MASKRIWRPGSGEPPGPVATAVTLAVSPSHRLVPQLPLDGTTVRPVSNSGAKRTVTLTIAVCPDWSVTVIATGTSEPTATELGTSTIVSPETLSGTGSTAGLFDSAWNGPSPPVILTVVGTPEYATMTPAGSVPSVAIGVGVGVVGLLIAPLPPPQAVSASVPASASSVRAGRSQRIGRARSMGGILMMLS
jgi:hypothetical protein